MGCRCHNERPNHLAMWSSEDPCIGVGEHRRFARCAPSPQPYALERKVGGSPPGLTHYHRFFVSLSLSLSCPLLLWRAVAAAGGVASTANRTQATSIAAM